MTISPNNLNALIGLSFSVSDLYGVSVKNYAIATFYPLETISSTTVVATGGPAAGITTSAGVTFEIVAVNNYTNSFTAAFSSNESVFGHSIQYDIIGYNVNSVLISIGSSNFDAISLDIGGDISRDLGIFSTNLITAGTTLSFPATNNYPGAGQSASSVIPGLYLSILGRPVDGAGFSSANAAADAGATYTQIAAALATSTEGQSGINALYQAVFGRAGDPSGLDAFTQYLITGGSLAGIRATLASSTEAQSAISNIYQAVLGRAVDDTGLYHFIQQLAGTVSLSDVRAAVAGSPEAQSDISSAYQSVLGRAADSAGRASFTQYLAAGGSLAGVRASMAGSPEAQSDISNAYQSVLGRAADTAGLASFTQYLAAGGSLGGVRASLAGSPEAHADLSNLYQTVLGRPADNGGLANLTQALATGTSLAAIPAILANSPEGQNKVTVTLQIIETHIPTAVEIASGQLQLASGVPLTDLLTQTANFLFATSSFTSAGGGNTVNGSSKELFDFHLGVLGQDTITGFDPATDVIELSRTQFPNLAAVRSDITSTSGGALLALDSANTILLKSVPSSRVTNADFRFV